MSRHVVWFSCGAASAVAAKLSLDYWDDVTVVYCDTMMDEHQDNHRFFDDIEAWLGVEVEVIYNDKYESVEEVWDDRSYMAGIHGAPCTVEMKKIPRFNFQHADDVHIFGYTADEEKRIQTFEDNNPDLALEWVLRDEGFTKQRCLDYITSAGIELPMMYQLGYKNNNCIGCVKATSAKYWNMTRRDFPERWEKRVEQSRRIGVKLTRYKGTRVFIDELPPDYMVGELENISCGPECADK